LQHIKKEKKKNSLNKDKTKILWTWNVEPFKAHYSSGWHLHAHTHGSWVHKVCFWCMSDSCYMFADITADDP